MLASRTAPGAEAGACATASSDGVDRHGSGEGGQGEGEGEGESTLLLDTELSRDPLAMEMAVMILTSLVNYHSRGLPAHLHGKEDRDGSEAGQSG